MIGFYSTLTVAKSIEFIKKEKMTMNTNQELAN